MTTFVFRCPVTRQQVQGQAESDKPAAAPTIGKTSYRAIPCPACGQVHIVNPSTGKLLSEERSRKP